MMKLSKSLRYLRLASAIKSSPVQTPEQFWKNLGIKKAQFNRDKKALEEIGFVFKYDRKQRRFVINKEPFLPVFDLKLTETFALTMAVRQLSAAGDYTLTYDALEAINKIIANAPGPQPEHSPPTQGVAQGRGGPKWGTIPDASWHHPRREYLSLAH